MPEEEEALSPPPEQAPPAPPEQGFPTGPPPKESGESQLICGLSRCKFIGLIVVIAIVAIGGGVFFRSEVQGCGCPEHYTSFHKQRIQLNQMGNDFGGDSCLCAGDIFLSLIHI